MNFNITNHNFFSDVFEKHKIHTLYKSVINTYTNSNIIEETYGDEEIITPNITTFAYVPDYLETITQNHFVCHKVFLKLGYLANLKNCNSIEDYTKTHFKSSFRNNIKRSVKRVESCLSSHYKTYYGSISHNEYTVLMEAFHKMLMKRFNQRNDKNLILENWAYYLETAFDKINQKKASLFVMYNNDEPIAFALNFHAKDTFYFSIPTFNLDYYKFTLGNVVIYKNLEWCLDNGFKIFDMGYGGFENKINWCNTTYNFNHHIIYHPKNRMGHLYTLVLKNKYKLINYLLSKNVNTLVRNLKNTLKSNKQMFAASFTLLKIENSKTIKEDDLQQINYNDKEYNFLKKPLNDFLYLNIEYVNDVSVYKFNNEPQQYVFKGKKSAATLKFTKS
ncbi:acetyltransferase (GNAT) family protein [Mariniflexile fucanivorans]|uniref:Acetyltransferase (GNAT) family protein n=1 Tax=Mariniflexile fucanivorans TaxID=264023 RepID=A0A4V2QDN1_9FLAO|nr:GNAT family N-acetyltransferase [Mariniflexile fucanivorans]TCL65027.1 acetyltransferase (GNAT) family protein [Mariniflexile fucanivorans]